jgi:hypothetical protein
MHIQRMTRNEEASIKHSANRHPQVHDITLTHEEQDQLQRTSLSLSP